MSYFTYKALPENIRYCHVMHYECVKFGLQINPSRFDNPYKIDIKLDYKSRSQCAPRDCRKPYLKIDIMRKECSMFQMREFMRESFGSEVGQYDGIAQRLDNLKEFFQTIALNPESKDDEKIMRIADVTAHNAKTLVNLWLIAGSALTLKQKFQLRKDLKKMNIIEFLDTYKDACVEQEKIANSKNEKWNKYYEERQAKQELKIQEKNNARWQRLFGHKANTYDSVGVVGKGNN